MDNSGKIYLNNVFFIIIILNMILPATSSLLEHIITRKYESSTFIARNLENILSRNFPKFRTGIVLISDGIDQSYPETQVTIYNQNNRAFIACNTNSLHKFNNKRDFGELNPYIILLTQKDVNTFDNILQNLTLTNIWDPRSNFIIILDATDQPYKNFSQNILLLCWKHDILNAIVAEISTDVEDHIRLQIFSYNPFPQRHNFMNLTSFWHRQRNLFLDKLRNLYGFTLRGTIHDFPPHAVETCLSKNQRDFNGYDGNMMKTLCKHLNARVKFISPQDGYTFGVLLKNGTITGSTGDIAYRRAEIALNSRFMKADWAYAVLPTYSHIKTDFCLIVPKAKFIPRYMNLILPFTIDLWTPVILSLPLATILWHIILRITGRWISENVTWVDLSLQTFGSFLLSSFKTLPDSDPERTYLLFWVLYSMVVNNAYQGSMTSFLAVPRFLKDIDTLEELDNSGYGVFAYPGSETYVKRDESNPVMTSLMKKFKESDPKFHVMSDKIIASGRMAGMADYNAAKYFVSLPRYQRGGFPLLHLMKECLVPGPHVYETARDSPFLYRFSEIIQRMVQAGLFDLWLDRTLEQAILKEKWDSEADTSKPRALQPEHLQSAFYLLVLGVVGSTAAFVGELYSARRQRKRSHEWSWR